MKNQAECETVIRMGNGNAFRQGDIVTVYFFGITTEPCTGKIDFIDTSDFSLDASERFSANARIIEYKDVLSIKKAESKEIFDPMRVNMVEVLAAIGVPVTKSDTDMHRRNPEQIGRSVWSALDCLERGIEPPSCRVEEKQEGKEK
jgi:hypothetical protein